jgi:hypothetical protein
MLRVMNNASVYDDEGSVSSAHYEELSGISKHEYEQRLLRGVQESLRERTSGPVDESQVQSVTLAGAGEDTKIVVIFRVANRGADRLFGWRIGIWPRLSPNHPEGTPEDYALLFDVYLDEAINTIPFHAQIQAPDDQGIEWIEDW